MSQKYKDDRDKLEQEQNIMKRAMLAKQEELRIIEEDRDRLQSELCDLKNEIVEVRSKIAGNDIGDICDMDGNSEFDFNSELLQEMSSKQGRGSTNSS